MHYAHFGFCLVYLLKQAKLQIKLDEIEKYKAPPLDLEQFEA